MYSCECDPCQISYQSYFTLETICSSSSFFSRQFMSKFTFTGRIDLTVLSQRLFLSLVHCAQTRENTRSTNALLTGIENIMVISLYRSKKELFLEKIFIHFFSAFSFRNTSTGIFLGKTLRNEILSVSQCSNNSSIIVICRSSCLAKSTTSLYLTIWSLSRVQFMCVK